jgi:hypothetical protein
MVLSFYQQYSDFCFKVNLFGQHIKASSKTEAGFYVLTRVAI